jgi:hypothetical protein
MNTSCGLDISLKIMGEMEAFNPLSSSEWTITIF